MVNKSVLLFCCNPYEGGVAKMFVEIVNGLSSKSGNEVYAAIDSDNRVKKYNEINAPLFKVDVKNREQYFHQKSNNYSIIYKLFRNLVYTFLYYPVKRRNILQFRMLLRKYKIDCVMAHSGGYHSDDLCLQMLEAAKKEKISDRILVLHNDFEKKSSLEKLYYASYDYRVMKIASRILCVSNFMKSRLERTSFLKNINVIYNGISMPKEGDSNSKLLDLGVAKDKFVIGMIGNFEERKGHLYFLKAMNELKKIEDVSAIIIGNIIEQDYYNICIEFINENDLQKKVSILSGIASAGKYAEVFDVMIFPSIEDESFGLVALEGMMYRVPVITFCCGGIPEVVTDKKAGFVLPLKDYSAIADKIVLLHQDSSLRKSIGEFGKKSWEDKFSTDIMINNYIELIKAGYHK